MHGTKQMFGKLLWPGKQWTEREWSSYFLVIGRVYWTKLWSSKYGERTGKEKLQLLECWSKVELPVVEVECRNDCVKTTMVEWHWGGDNDAAMEGSRGEEGAGAGDWTGLYIPEWINKLAKLWCGRHATPGWARPVLLSSSPLNSD